MRFAVTDVNDYYRPEKCRLRVYLRHHGVEEAPPGPFQQVLWKLGKIHEGRHLAELASLGQVADLSTIAPEERARRSLEAMSAGAPVIYQGRLAATFDLDGEACELVGEPDFLIRAADGYVVRDSKLSRQITRSSHPEILLQLQLYGWLYEKNTGAPPAGLEVHAGDGRIVAIPYDGGIASLDHLRLIRGARTAEAEFYEPVGWSKCGGCGFRERCWKRAESSDDISILPGVDQSLARKLNSRGVTSVSALIERFEDDAFRDVFYEKRKKEPKLRDSAVNIRRAAEAHRTGKPIRIAPLHLPVARAYVMIDLEGMPPYFNELEKVYLWGMKVTGDKRSHHIAALAGPSESSDRECWLEFLRLAGGLLEEHGDVSFVHWGHYEKTKITMYVNRFGDSDGVAARVLANLVNLLPITQDSLALPIPSYSLKVVERYIRFRRSLTEANGEWAMARYIDATETDDPAARSEVLAQIKAYNEEDLDATWAVFSWLRDTRDMATGASCENGVPTQ